MKKYFAVLVLCVFTFFALNSYDFSVVKAAAPLPDFSDDFESYDTGKIEDILSFRNNWDNDYFSGDNAEGVQQTNVASVVYENGTDGNKVLYVDNIKGDGSFFFISAGKGSKYKNFNVSFKIKILDVKTDFWGWFGINCRKQLNTRYNSTNGMLLTYKYEQDTNYFTPTTYRYLPSTQILLNSETAEEYGAEYVTDEKYETTALLGEWADIKIEVKDSEYKMYVNNTLTSHFNYSKKAINDYGFVSFNVCVCKLMMDNFHLENLDEEAPPVDNKDDGSNNSGETISPSKEDNQKPEENKKGCKKSSDFSNEVSAIILFVAITLGLKIKR